MTQAWAGQSWSALVLAAGRGPHDPMARVYGVSHKCLVEVTGQPMLARVVAALRSHPAIRRIALSIDDRRVAETAMGSIPADLSVIASRESAAASTAAALASGELPYPVLVTTADHVLLDHAMLDHFLAASAAEEADLTVGVALAESILAAYPATRRTFLALGRDRISGCNLYGLMTARALRAVELWQQLDRDRKRPWRLIAAFGAGPLVRYVIGRTDLAHAFDLASRRLGITATPILMPAEAAIDVDKPADKELCETILERRRSAGA